MQCVESIFGTSTTSNQPVAGSIMVNALNSIILPFGWWHLSGPIMSRLTLFQGIAGSATFSGRSPFFLELVFLQSWHLWQVQTYCSTSLSMPLQCKVWAIVLACLSIPGWTKYSWYQAMIRPCSELGTTMRLLNVINSTPSKFRVPKSCFESCSFFCKALSFFWALPMRTGLKGNFSEMVSELLAKTRSTTSFHQGQNRIHLCRVVTSHKHKTGLWCL